MGLGYTRNSFKERTRNVFSGDTTQFSVLHNYFDLIIGYRFNLKQKTQKTWIIEASLVPQIKVGKPYTSTKYGLAGRLNIGLNLPLKDIFDINLGMYFKSALLSYKLDISSKYIPYDYGLYCGLFKNI